MGGDFMEVFIFIVIIVTMLLIAVSRAKTNVENRTETEDKKPKIDVKAIQFDNVPQGLNVTIVCLEDDLLITTNGYKRKIPYESVVDITIEHASQISSNPKFSVGKAAAGVALLGSAGAVAGVSGKTEELKMMVLSYSDSTKLKYMVFLQQHDKGMTVKAEALLLDRACKEILQLVKQKK